MKTPSPPAVDRAFAILELLAQSRHGMTAPELQEKLHLPKSSVHYILLSLATKGYLHRNLRTGRYRLGLKLFSLANFALSGLDLRESAMPALNSIMRRTGLTVHLAILDRDDVVLVAKVEPVNGPRLATWLGKRMELHCTALGKVLLGYMPEERVDHLMNERGMPRHNDNTIVSPRRLKAELAAVRTNGYSLDDEEDELGMRCVGVPVFNENLEVIAAVGVAGTTMQITADNKMRVASELKSGAAQIVEALGYGQVALAAAAR